MLDEGDHRAIGARMGLFHLQEEAPGMVFWHPRGWVLYRLIEGYLRDRLAEHGYQEVRTPLLLGRALWEGSGHWQHFGGGMMRVDDDDGEPAAALKPVNCPAHVQIFNQGVRSYRELPLRLSEFGACHRNEPSGSLCGLMRVRGFVQDDGHIFCLEEQVDEEVARFCELLKGVYAAFGMEEAGVKLSTRPSVRLGSDEAWDRAESALARAAQAAGLDPEPSPGEGAFYGPKLEFSLRDARGRSWQCGTIQLDRVMPERLDASYVAASGARARPVMLHRAVLGSIERFVAIVLEQYRGDLPLWLAPEQVVVATLSEAHRAYGQRVLAALRLEGYRASLDARAETIGRKVVEARNAGAAALWVVGAREAAEGLVSARGRDGRLSVLPIAEALASLRRGGAA